VKLALQLPTSAVASAWRGQPAVNPNRGVSARARDFRPDPAARSDLSGGMRVSGAVPRRNRETGAVAKPLRELAAQTKTPRLVASASSVNRRGTISRDPFSSSGGRIRTSDLRVMSPTSYQAALPRDLVEAYSRAAAERVKGETSVAPEPAAVADLQVVRGGGKWVRRILQTGRRGTVAAG
jgi:hypothetical protein